MNVISLYPEYLTDVKVLVCPSDAGVSADAVSEMLDVIGSGDPQGIYTDATAATGTTIATSSHLQRFALTRVLNRAYSYAYIAWATMSDGSIVPTNHMGYFVEGWKWPGGLDGAYVDRDFDIDLSTIDPNNDWCGIEAIIEQKPGDPVVTIYYEGSGGGCTLYRTREGIERFMITDINNPAGSAKAQSEIPVMFDGIASGWNDFGGMNSIESFNHVPGGANVLFMDGHVQFIKYPGDFPITLVSAHQGWGNPGRGVDPSDGKAELAPESFAYYDPAINF